MRAELPVDIDDLVTSCRAENARRAFAEAVACYRAGAYRACIVVTWTAVVFDFVGKLRELEVAGNGEAKDALVEWDTARRNGDFLTAMRLEERMLGEAEKRFDLLSPIEREDLERLRADRHRCAHPSLLTLDEPYVPSAELARVHMRHAVAHLLSRPPVQGKEASDRVWADISSEFFPTDADAAATRLHALMSRARPTLVRTVAVELTRKLLSATDTADHDRARAALLGLMKLHHMEVDQLLRDKLTAIASSVSDDDLELLVRYCRHIGGAWAALGAALQGKLKLYVERTDAMDPLADALALLPLRENAIQRLPNLGGTPLRVLAQLSKDGEVLEHIVGMFETSTSFVSFAALWPALADEGLASHWTVEQRKRLVTALRTNPEVGRYGGYRNVLRATLALCTTSPAEYRDEWRQFFDSIKPDGYSAKVIREVYTDFPGPPDEQA